MELNVKHAYPLTLPEKETNANVLTNTGTVELINVKVYLKIINKYKKFFNVFL